MVGFMTMAGTTRMVHGPQPETRAKTQGSSNLWYQLFGLGADVVSGMLMNATRFDALTTLGGILAWLIIPAIA